MSQGGTAEAATHIAGSETSKGDLRPHCVVDGLQARLTGASRGSVFAQLLVLGATQVSISISVNAIIAVTAGSIAVFLARRPAWAVVQRWLMGTVLAGMAVRMATEAQR